MTLKQQFDDQGYLLLEGFNTPEACDALVQRGEELSRDFQPDDHPSIFQTDEQTRTSDDYFLDSGGRISYFFEKDAFDQTGQLKNDIFHSLNKIGHGLHDLDPIFANFSRSPQMKKLAADLGLSDSLLIQSMLIFKHARIGAW